MSGERARTSWRRAAGVGGLIALSTMLGGCASWFGSEQAPDSAEVITKRGPAPSYVERAERYNQRIEPLDRVFARAAIRLTYTDDKGEEKTEQLEGRLQIVRPDRLALVLSKAGQVLLWFGCDPERYWWFDLTESSNRVVAVGRHDRYTDDIGRRIGVALRPLDLIRVLGIVPIDAQAPGATQWSKNGRLLGITSVLPSGGLQRVWVDPDTDEPESIEVFDASRRLVVAARHEGKTSVELASGRFRPPIAERITVRHAGSNTEVRLALSGVKDSGVSDRAFELDELLERYPVDRTIDLDAPRPRAATPGRAGE